MFVDGLDLIVGAVVSAAVAGLGAVVAAYLGSLVARNALVISIIAWATGGVFMCGSYLMIAGLPDRADLITLEPRVVHYAYVDKSINGDVLRLYDATGRSVTIGPRKDYYPKLVAAVAKAQNYRVLYARERALFSGEDESYPVVYDVSVNGETLESFEYRANQMRLFCSGTFAFGFVMLMGGFLVPRFAPPEPAVHHGEAPVGQAN